jgi:RimJ/RimL family protein N-acetyltransferase
MTKTPFREDGTLSHMNEKDAFSTERLFMRQFNLELDSMQDYLKWMRDIKSNPFIVSVNPTYSMDELLEYVHQKNSLEDALLFGIFLSKSGGLIGTIKLEPIDRNTCQAWLGVMIGNTDFRHLGYGTEAIKGILRYSKEVLSLKKITLGVDFANTVAIDTYLKIGFSIEMRKESQITMSISL